MRRVGVFALFLAAVAPADEITGPRGRPIAGTLVLTGGQLILQGPDGLVLAKGANLGLVKVCTTRKTFAAGPPHRVMLSADEQVTGVFLGMQRETLSLRTAWADRLAIPRGSTLALTHLSGWRTEVHDTFAGKPTRLTGAGQSVAVSVVPLPAARVSVLFQEVARPAGLRAVVEAEYAVGVRVRTVRITLTGDGDILSVDAGGLPGTSRKVRRSAALRCLTLEQSAGSLRISCDDEVLWFTLDAGPGKLRRVRLGCEASEAKVSGSVDVSAVIVEAAEPVQRRPRGDPARDELWLASGDQLFGTVRRADGQGIEIAGKFGTRSYAWKELRGWYPRRTVVRPRAAIQGVKVQLEIDSGMRAEPDVLVGTLSALDAKQATMRHAVLGELTIPRQRIVSVRPLIDR